MRISCLLWIIVGSVALLHVGGHHAAAQIEIGGAATVSSIRDGTFGVNGRLIVPVRESRRMGVVLQAAVDYYWPSCESVNCDVIGTQLNVIFQNRIGGRADTYFGAGATYQRITLEEDDQTLVEGDTWGANFVVGTRYASQTALHPFLEVSWTLLDDIDNQLAVSFGATVTLGR